MGRGCVRHEHPGTDLVAEAAVLWPVGWALGHGDGRVSWASPSVMRAPQAGSRRRHLCAGQVTVASCPRGW